MNHPIQNKIGSVFIPVSDMSKAVAWYNNLLGLAGTISHNNQIYTIPMSGETGLILDSNKPVSNSSQPLFFFWSEDITETLRFLQENTVEITSDIEDIGSVSFISFKDLDNNLLMVCQKN